MQLLFEVYDLVGWGQKYDDSDAESITAELTVDTAKCRHKLTVYGLKDERPLMEMFRGTTDLRILYDAQMKPEYVLEVCNYETVQFPVTHYSLETRDLPRHNQ